MEVHSCSRVMLMIYLFLFSCSLYWVDQEAASPLASNKINCNRKTLFAAIDYVGPNNEKSLLTRSA